MTENIKKNMIPKVDVNITKEELKSNRLFGLWIYLMSDCIMFAVLFAVYSIMSLNITNNLLIKGTFFNLSTVLAETLVLLLSSLLCGLIVKSMKKKDIKMIYLYLIITFFLGFIFIFMEIKEFYELIENNYSPSQHAFFSIFFTLIGTHGIHVLFGLLLIISIFYQIQKLGLTDIVKIRILCFTIFWHFLDIIWICVFTFVYLNGAI